MCKIIEINNSDYSKEIIIEIVAAIKSNKIIIMPSDTIYGFLCLDYLEEKLRKIKKRDKKPFLYLISKISDLKILKIDIKEYLFYFKKYWPGKVTFIVEDKNKKNIGVRMPLWKILRKIINDVKKPLISTSVNFTGQMPINDIDRIICDFKDKIDLIISDRNFKPDLSSTIADITGNNIKIIRQGSVILDEK